jgi:chitinase
MVSLRSLLSVSAVAATAMASFDPTGKDNVVMYWGQAYENDPSLGDYCQTTDGDVYIISFLNQFGTNESPSFNVEGCYNTFPNSTLFNCPGVGQDIQTCQGLGKKVFLSLGGAVGNYGFTNTNDAQSFALELWNLFGGGNAAQRPFGNAIVDGFDLDIENNSDIGYAALVTALRGYFGSNPYYISTAPLCGVDAGTAQALEESDVDFAFVQFYSGSDSVCAPLEAGFNFNSYWTEFVSTRAYNKNLKIYLGLLGAASGGSGFVPPAQLGPVISDIYCDDAFGGVMFWQASTANSTIYNGQTYPAYVNSLLDNQVCTPNTDPASSQPVKNIGGASSTTSASASATSSGYGNSSVTATTSLPGDTLVTITTEEIGTSTEVVTAYTTYCPFATKFTEGGSTYVVTEATTITVTNCPCTRTTEYTTQYTTVCPLSEVTSANSPTGSSGVAAVATSTGSGSGSGPVASSAAVNGSTPVAVVTGEASVAAANGAVSSKVGAGLMAAVLAFAVLL